jgi:hypothetical protein
VFVPKFQTLIDPSLPYCYSLKDKDDYIIPTNSHVELYEDDACFDRVGRLHRGEQLRDGLKGKYFMVYYDE